MSTSTTLMARTAFSSSFHLGFPPLTRLFVSSNPSSLAFASSPLHRSPGLGLHAAVSSSIKLFCSAASAAAAEDRSDTSEDSHDTVEELLTQQGSRIERLMKMERLPEPEVDGRVLRWFPYRDAFRSGNTALGSQEVIAALEPYITEGRKERIRKVVENRSYSTCLVVEGLTDFGNVSAAFRSADALGIQSVHVITKDSSKRCNQH